MKKSIILAVLAIVAIATASAQSLNVQSLRQRADTVVESQTGTLCFLIKILPSDNYKESIQLGQEGCYVVTRTWNGIEKQTALHNIKNRSQLKSVRLPHYTWVIVGIIDGEIGWFGGTSRNELIQYLYY